MYGWILVMTLTLPMTHPLAIPMKTQEACELAKKQLEKQYAIFQTKRLICIKQY